MNKSLNALMTKLNWQLNELNLHLHEAQNQIQQVTQHIQAIDEHIDKARMNSLVINPELEISRLNFVTQQQEEKDDLSTALKNHQDVEKKLNDKIQRLKTELKMLEKYVQRDALSQKEQEQKNQANAMDEWVIQNREPR